jgi:hypothetical protein
MLNIIGFLILILVLIKSTKLAKSTNLAKSTKLAKSKGQQLLEHNVRGDGNCLYRCIAIDLYDNEDYHEIVRKNMIKFVQDRQFVYKNSGNLTESIDSWIEKMSKCGEYGDAFALELLSWMLERPIVVQVRSGNGNKLLFTETMGNWFNTSTIQLVLRNEHYTIIL